MHVEAVSRHLSTASGIDMIVQIIEEFRIETENAVPAVEAAESFDALHSEIEGIRRNMVNAIRESAGRRAPYAPCYHAVIDTGEEHAVDVFAVEYFDCPSVDHAFIRSLKRDVKAAVSAIASAELTSLEGSAFEGSLLFFHELNDMISEQSDAINEEFDTIYDERDFMDGDLNTDVLPDVAGYGYLLSESNILCTPDGRKGKSGSIPKDIDRKLIRLRLIMRETMISALEGSEGFHFFPGSYVSSFNTETSGLTTRFFDVIGYPPEITEEEAGKIICRAYEDAARVFSEERGGGRITYPVLSAACIIPDNPPRFFSALMEKAELYRDENRSLDTMEFRYI